VKFQPIRCGVKTAFERKLRYSHAITPAPLACGED
jgi:hypothetical protein